MRFSRWPQKGRFCAVRVLAPVLVFLSAAVAQAEVTRFAEVEGFARLLEGDPETVMLSEEGAVGLRPATRQRFFDPTLRWGAAGTYGDDVVVATLGAKPMLLAIDEAGRQRPLFPLGEAMVTRLTEIAAARKQHAGLWAAISEAGAAQLLWWPSGATPDLQREGSASLTGQLRRTAVPARFVWDIVADGVGGAYLATGEPGALMHIDAKQQVRTLCETSEAHVKSVHLDAKMGLFVGGGERGIVYHAAVPTPGKPTRLRALFDTGQQEVTSLKTDGRMVYVASVSGQAGDDAQGAAGAPARVAKAAEVRSALHKVDLAGAAEILAASSDELLFDLAFDEEGRLLVATGALGKSEPRGRLYRVETKRKMVSLIYQSSSKRLLRLLPLGRQMVIVEQEGARLTSLPPGVQPSGTYVSPVIDAGIMSRFGLLQALAELPKGSRAMLSVRTGQSAEPDASWSPYSPAIEAPANVPVEVPNGRYAQIRVQLSGSAQAQPLLYKLRLAFLRQNLPPFVQDIYPLSPGQALYALSAAVTGDDGHSRVVVLEGKSESTSEAGAASRKPPLRARQVTEPGAMTLRWTVDEPNGDDLEYRLQVRGPGEQEFRLVADGFVEPFHTFHSAQLADGWYTFRLQASDVRSNPAPLAKTDQRDSRAILIDNSPPVFRQLRASSSKGQVTITGAVADRYSAMVTLEASVDGGPLRALLPSDGLLDGLRESFSLPLPALAPGAHTVTLRARDEADNTGHASIQFAVPNAPRGRHP